MAVSCAQKLACVHIQLLGQKSHTTQVILSVLDAGLLFYMHRPLDKECEGKLRFTLMRVKDNSRAAVVSKFKPGQAGSWLEHPANSMVSRASPKEKENTSFAFDLDPVDGLRGSSLIWVVRTYYSQYGIPFLPAHGKCTEPPGQRQRDPSHAQKSQEAWTRQEVSSNSNHTGWSYIASQDFSPTLPENMVGHMQGQQNYARLNIISTVILRWTLEGRWSSTWGASQ